MSNLKKEIFEICEYHKTGVPTDTLTREKINEATIDCVNKGDVADKINEITKKSREGVHTYGDVLIEIVEYAQSLSPKI